MRRRFAFIALLLALVTAGPAYGDTGDKPGPPWGRGEVEQVEVENENP